MLWFKLYVFLSLNPICLLFSDSLSSGDDEDYDEDPADAGNGNGEFLIFLFKPHHTSETYISSFQPQEKVNESNKQLHEHRDKKQPVAGIRDLI